MYIPSFQQGLFQLQSIHQQQQQWPQIITEPMKTKDKRLNTVKQRIESIVISWVIKVPRFIKMKPGSLIREKKEDEEMRKDFTGEMEADQAETRA